LGSTRETQQACTASCKTGRGLCEKLLTAVQVKERGESEGLFVMKGIEVET
jgi:hypothetical protein